MRSIGLAPVVLVTLLGCVSFDLDSRRFRCDDDPYLCGDGWFCSVSGYCEPLAPIADGGPSDARVDLDAGGEICDNSEEDDGDELVDCQDPECGLASCDDDSPCTEDVCQPSGACNSTPLQSGAACGAGCTCADDGVAIEVACGDFQDNDGDDLHDCNDSDCPECSGILVCCPDGGCRTSC